jgi:hypothetical protein
VYRSTECRRRGGAAVENLAHSASFHSGENNAPSKRGIKHLERVDIQDSGSVGNLIQAPFRGALDVVGSTDAERPPVGADTAALAGQAG